jgi:nucleoside-diphosphate-sugar epimerase
MSVVLVTGGSGFIGSHCILQLLHGGHTVRATVRLSFFAAELENDAGWRDAVAGWDYVLHVASPLLQHVPKNADELVVAAREGTRRVLRASRDTGVKRVVLTSSFAAIGYGQKPQAKPFDESNWTNADAEGVQPYAKSKTLAERAAWDFVAREGGGLELAVINPVMVAGPVLGPDYSSSIILVQVPCRAARGSTLALSTCATSPICISAP